MRILLADDHNLFRDALVQYIERAEPDVELYVSKDFDGAYEILEENDDFDLVLLDLKMPGMHGLSGLEKIVRKYSDLRVALMSGVAEEKDVQEALEKGAVAYFPKTLSGKALLSAIQLVLTGEEYVPLDYGTQSMMPSYYADEDPYMHSNVEPLYAGMHEKQDSLGQARTDAVRLTPRETEVLQYLMKGASNKEIANDLGLQVVTVKLHVRGICRKLDAKNRTHAAMKAKEMGFGQQ